MEQFGYFYTQPPASWSSLTRSGKVSVENGQLTLRMFTKENNAISIHQLLRMEALDPGGAKDAVFITTDGEHTWTCRISRKHFNGLVKALASQNDPRFNFNMKTGKPLFSSGDKIPADTLKELKWEEVPGNG